MCAIAFDRFDDDDDDDDDDGDGDTDPKETLRMEKWIQKEALQTRRGCQCSPKIVQNQAAGCSGLPFERQSGPGTLLRVPKIEFLNLLAPFGRF